MRFFDLGTQIAQPILLDGNTLRVGAAIGISEAMPGMTFDVVLDQADKLMYDAKASGKIVDIRTNIQPVATSEFGILNYASKTA